jgi:spore coat protein CotH
VGKLSATLLTVALCIGSLANPASAQTPTADDLFNSTEIQQLELWLNSSDWSKLKENFQENTYYPADVTWNGQTVRNVGIRSRGRGSRSATKPGLRVDFNRYSTDQTFLGLKSLVLDNLTQDASGVHETVAMAFYARLGIPASREIHTRLYVNGAYIGVYAIVESVDKDMLARVFGVIGEDTQNDGWLYEFKYQDYWYFTYFGSDLAPYKARFEATTHESATDEEKYRRIEELVRVTNQTTSTTTTADLGPRLDIPAVIRFIAAQLFLAETDGFLGGFGINNLYLYRLENSEVHTFIAWDADNTFYNAEYPTNSGANDNILMRALMSVPEYNTLFYSELARAVQMAEADDWLNTEIIRHIQRIDQAMKEDPSKPFSNNSYEGKAGEMLTFARARITFVKCELERGAGNSSCRTQ